MRQNGSQATHPSGEAPVAIFRADLALELRKAIESPIYRSAIIIRAPDDSLEYHHTTLTFHHTLDSDQCAELVGQNA
jgi:hypothetical protein